MPRPRRIRYVDIPPRTKGFRPMEQSVTTTVLLTLDQYEAIRIADLEGLSHSEAAEKMNISRPTFTRILESAHKKLADMLINSKQLIIEGGDIHFDNFLFLCADCGYEFKSSCLEKTNICPQCGSTHLINRAEYFGHGECCTRGRRKRGRHGI